MKTEFLFYRVRLLNSKYCRKGEDRPPSKEYPEQLKRLQPDKVAVARVDFQKEAALPLGLLPGQLAE